VTRAFPFVRNADVDIRLYDFVARVRGGIQSKEELFDELASKLNLPAYFGRNWEALDECLSELDWLPGKRIAILHDGAPHLSRRELVIYLSILDASWIALEDAGRLLTIGFPAQTQVLTDAWSGVKR